MRLKFIYSTDATYSILYIVQPGPISTIPIYLLYIKTDIVTKKKIQYEANIENKDLSLGDRKQTTKLRGK